MTPNPEPPPAFTLQVHPPERRDRRPAVVLGCGCCCCCCCLHTVGSLIGAAAGSVPSVDAETGRHRPSAAGLYWLLTGVGAVVVGGMGMAEEHGASAGPAILYLLLFLPFVQLGAAVLAALGVALYPSEHKGAYLASVGRLALWTFVGGLVGVLLMVGGCGALSWLH